MPSNVRGGSHFPPLPSAHALPTAKLQKATYSDVLQRGVNDLVVVWQTVELERVEVQKDVMAELYAVNVSMRLQPTACGRDKKGRSGTWSAATEAKGTAWTRCPMA